MEDELNRIIIMEKGKNVDGKNVRIFGDLQKCQVCKINFSAFPRCIMCTLIAEKEKKIGRRLTRIEFRKLVKEFFGED